MKREINIQINPLSDIALYEQIAEQLKQLIVSGALAEHSPLPSVRGLAQALEVSVITTRRAYTELEQQGYVITTPAKGTFVSYRYKDRLKELGMSKLDELLFNAAHLGKALQIEETELLGRLSAHYTYVQEHDYNPLKARQIVTQFIRNR